MPEDELSELAELRELVETLRRSVRARDDFIAIAAHELRNPMTPIVGVAELALIAARRAEGKCPPRVIILLERLQRLVQDYVRRATKLLDVSRLETGNLQLESVATNLSRLVLSTVHRYEAEAAHQQCALEHDIEADVRGHLDPLAVEQVIDNLVSNAVKFGAGKPVAVQLRSDGRAACLKVRDAGIGMSVDQQERIFGRFEQIVARHDGSGFGLGLWIAGRLIAAMDGRVTVSSRPGEGSTFTVILPLVAGGQDRTRMTEHEVNAAADRDAEIKRVPSHVPGLDTILCGGFLSGGVYLIQGSAGAGKTVLASQIAYSHAAQGNRALFVTVLGENHGRMMAHLRPMRFFDQSLVPDGLTYISAYQALDQNKEGLRDLTALLAGEVRERGPVLLVLDGLSAVEAKAGSSFEIKRFAHELQALALATDCTMLLLNTPSGPQSTAEHTLVDGVIELQQRIYALRSERRLRVHKSRGSSHLEGQHAFRISHDGITVFPRIEAQFLNLPASDGAPRVRVSSGIASLDGLLYGGIPAATMAAVVGPAGAGKTTFGLQFLAASSAAEPGLLFGCYESPDRLRLKAETMGLGLATAEQRGEIELLWYPVGEQILDELAHRLLDAVQRRGIKRLVIDGISGFQESALERERMVRFWSVLAGQLRALGVTTLHTMELPELMGTEIREPMGGVSAMAEVLILLRFVELQSRLFRLISVFKVRDGSFDPTIREFTIADAGIAVGKPFEGVEAVLSGIAREAARAAVVIPSEDNRAELPDRAGQPG